MAKFTKFDTFSDVLFSFQKFEYSKNETNTKEYKKMIKILKEIIEHELTSKQRRCVIMYYKNNMNTIEISSILGVYPSTVWRHIKKSKDKIKKIIRYYYKI